MRRATPLGHEPTAPTGERENKPQSIPAGVPTTDEQDQVPPPFSVVRGGAPAEAPRRRSGEHRRRLTPTRAVIQPSDPDRLRRALEALREMNKLTRRRTEEMRKLSELSRDLAHQMGTFGSVIGGLKIGPQRRSVG